MRHNISTGEVLITPNLSGPRFQITQSPSLTLATKDISIPWWHRFLGIIGITIVCLSLPQLSRAATYTNQDILSSINAVRSAHGLAPVTANTKLQQAAEEKATDMFAHQYFNHYSPTGKAPWDFMKNTGYHYSTAGENLAIDFIDGADVVTMWMTSPGHRENILSPDYRETGVAVMDGMMNGKQSTIVVQLFGSLLSGTSAITAQPVMTKSFTIQRAVKKPAVVEKKNNESHLKETPKTSPVDTLIEARPIPPPVVSAASFPGEIPTVHGLQTSTESPATLESTVFVVSNSAAVNAILYALGYYALFLISLIVLNKKLAGQLLFSQTVFIAD